PPSRRDAVEGTMLTDAAIANAMWLCVVLAYAWSVWRLNRPWRDRPPADVVCETLIVVSPRTARTGVSNDRRTLGGSSRRAGGRRQLAKVAPRSQRDSLAGSKRL